jgi:hypothetical protein
MRASYVTPTNAELPAWMAAILSANVAANWPSKRITIDDRRGNDPGLL